jgi:hypothetical protein
MIENIVTFTAMGFGMSLLIYFWGQSVRLFVEVIDTMTKR